MKVNGFIAVVLLVSAGCVSSSPAKSGYLSPDEDVYGKAEKLEYTQKRMTVTIAIERMLTDPTFTTKYAAALAKAKNTGHALPSLTIRKIENNSGIGGDEATSQMYRELQTVLRKTGKFEIIDRVKRKEMTTAGVSAVDEGESSLAIQGVGSYRSADFVMSGELRRVETTTDTRSVYHHNVNLQMLDSTDGTMFWSETVPVVKFVEKE